MVRAAIWPALLTILLFASCLGGGFIYDDEPMLVENNRVVEATPRAAFTSDFMGFSSPKDWPFILYRPLTVLSFSGLYRIFGLSPFAFHWASVLLHATATASFYWLLLALGQRTPVALAAAVLFAVHPLHVEAVAWMICLADTQSGACVLLSLVCFAYGKRNWSWLFAALALFSKESAMILPALVFVVAYLKAWKGKSTTFRERLAAAVPAIVVSIPFVLLDAIFVAVRWKVLPHPPPGAVSRAVLAGLPHSPVVTAQFLKALFWPWPLAVHYELGGFSLVIGALLAAALFIVVMVRVERLRRDLALSAAFIVLPLLSSVAAALIRTQWLQVHDRNGYLSTTGACLLVAVLLAQLPGRGLFYACLLLAPLGALGTYLQIGFWSDNETFWRHTLEVTPTSRPAALNLGYALYVDQRFSEAEDVYRKALQYRPKDKDLNQSLAAIRGGHPLAGVPAR